MLTWSAASIMLLEQDCLNSGSAVLQFKFVNHDTTVTFILGNDKGFEQTQRYLETYYLALKLSNLDLRAISNAHSAITQDCCSFH